MTLNSNWDTDYFEDAETHLGEVVDKVFICAHKNENNDGDDGQPPTNHWSTFLRINDEKSVELDMAPGYGTDGTRGKIVIAKKNNREHK